MSYNLFKFKLKYLTTLRVFFVLSFFYLGKYFIDVDNTIVFMIPICIYLFLLLFTNHKMIFLLTVLNLTLVNVLSADIHLALFLGNMIFAILESGFFLNTDLGIYKRYF